MPTPSRSATGWYFTGDTGYVDEDGDLFVTGRVDDMIITGGENVSPVEIESCLSLHPAVSEVAVVGLPDERWGKIVAAFIKRTRPGQRSGPRRASAATSGLANFKRPRRYIFVDDIPKSPVGKLLRRKLVAGEYRGRDGRSSALLNRQRNAAMTATQDHRRSAASTNLDGFRVEIDAARERADIILDRPPLNVIAMPQRDQIRQRVRGARRGRTRARDRAARRSASISPRAATSRASSRPRPSTSPSSPGTSPPRPAAPSRSIVANRGYSFGVGFEISLACDFRIVSETCHYALPEQKLGQIPGSGGSARLQKIVGITRTKDIVMRSKRIPGRQALEWGIATDCVARRRAGSGD